MADANKRINLTAPLLSVRRHGGGGAETAATGLPLPAYKADATSDPPGHTSAVPFGWEHRPGHPKSVRTRRPPPPPPPAPPPPLTIVDVNDNEPSRVTRDPTAVVVASERARRGEEPCSDALSRDDVSCVTVNCSATGLSDAAGAGAGSGPCARGSGSVMMDRFLRAAHAVAAGSPQNTFRKAGSARAAVVLGAHTTGGDRVPAQRRVPLQHIAAYHLPPLPPSGKNDDDDDDNSDAHSTAGFASKSCGLLSTRCVKSALLLSRVARRGAGTPFQSNGDGSQREKKPMLPPRSRNGQRRLLHTGDDHGMISQQSWEEVYIKSLLRSSGPGGLMGPAAAVASELDRTVHELYKRRDGRAVRPKASHLGLLLVLDRSNEACGHVSPVRKLSRIGDTALLLTATTKSSPDGDKQLGREHAAADAGGGGYGFPLLLEDKEAVAGREMALSPQPLLRLPLPKSPTESWLSLALPSVSTRPPATSFLGLHVQPKKRAPLPRCSSIDSSRDVHHDRQRQIRVYHLLK
ncbi:uncharacterized protein [Miscanthus floridulus]|uniref:uncharacterized protein n=1 Tax=Miscanthus floridulus TaxID=154761 RepID=UPI0034580C44